jgi:hypothetical protein
MTIANAGSGRVTTSGRRRVAAKLLLIITVGALACRAADSAVAGQEPADPLEVLNNNSRMLYAQAKAMAMARKDPVLIVVGDDLVLRKGERRTSVRVIPQIYHTLKSFAHIPMALDVALAAHGESPLDEETLRELREYRGLFAAATEKLVTAGLGLDGEERERQKAILAAATAFLDSILEKRRCTSAERIGFARQTNPLVMANAAAAARAALDMLHRQVCQWKGEMTPEEWCRVTVLVIGRQLPRKDNMAVQYFARLFGQSGEGKRLIYAEGLAEEPRALDLLATYRVDTQVGIDFFNDPLRMQRDLLADGARSYLPLLIDHP